MSQICKIFAKSLKERGARRASMFGCADEGKKLAAHPERQLPNNMLIDRLPGEAATVRPRRRLAARAPPPRGPAPELPPLGAATPAGRSVSDEPGTQTLTLAVTNCGAVVGPLKEPTGALYHDYGAPPPPMRSHQPTPCNTTASSQLGTVYATKRRRRNGKR